MNCTHCNAELEEGSTLCPNCGKDNAPAPAEAAPAAAEVETAPPSEATPKKKRTWIIVTALICAVIIALGAAVGIYLSGSKDPDPDPAATDATRENNAQYRDSYTGEGEALQAAMDTVVATVGDYTLTNSQLQVYYWMQYYDFVNTYGSYASLLGLDLSQPLDSQSCSAYENGTWQQYFLETALAGWQRYQVLNVMAEDAQFQLSENFQNYFDQLPSTLETSALQAGFTSAEEMLWGDMGQGCTLEDYLSYMHLYYTGYGFFSQEYDALDPTDAEVEDYYDQNQGTLEDQGITKESGKFYDVRHILIQPEGGTQDADGNTTYSDAEWDACLQKAQDLLDQWLAGEATEESFATLANEHSSDGGSNTNGGLYSDLTSSTNFVTEFKDWYLEENREAGDYGLVKSSYGYHIMYFSGSVDQWFSYAKSGLISDTLNARISEAAEDYPLTVYYDRILLGLPYTASSDSTATTEAP